MAIRDVLKSPRIYQSFQEALGFFNARVHAVSSYLSIRPGMRVIDIGCGPGFIVRHLPKGVDYVGFDIDEAYIAYAKKNFGDRGQFHRRLFTDDEAREFAPADLVMMNGVVHHLSDDDSMRIFASIGKVLAANGTLFTLDGCYRDGQNPVARRLLDNDRGEHVRDESGYRNLLAQAFSSVETEILEDLSWVPYTFIFARSNVPRSAA